MSEQTVTTIPDPQAEGHLHRIQEEPTVPPVQVSSNSDPKLYTKEDLEKAREQEKSKVYKRLETMQETVARLEAEREDRLKTEEAARKAAEEAAEKERQEQLSVKDLLAEKEAQWRREQEELRQQIEAERALRERESQFAELMEARNQIISQYSDRVAPELIDLIAGETPEQIQQSAEDMAARTERILAQTAEAMQNARQQMPTARVTAPASGDNSGANRQYSPDEIRGMSMADYAKHRASLLGKGADGTKSRGLFG
jgi:DNA repair exonuclease SbcCD ATPase subunit